MSREHGPEVDDKPSCQVELWKYQYTYIFNKYKDNIYMHHIYRTIDADWVARKNIMLLYYCT